MQPCNCDFRTKKIHENLGQEYLYNHSILLSEVGLFSYKGSELTDTGERVICHRLHVSGGDPPLLLSDGVLGVPPACGPHLSNLDHVPLQQGQLCRVAGRIVAKGTKMLHVDWLQKSLNKCSVLLLRIYSTII